MDAGHVQVSFELRDFICLVKVSGELTVVTEEGFTARAAEVLAKFRGPIAFDLSGLTFVDRHGARALVRALRAVPPRPAGLHGCSPATRRVLLALGLDRLPPTAAAVETPAGQPPAGAGARSRGETLAALSRASAANARQSAAQASEVMSRLAATYAELALNSRYRAAGKSTERGQLLTLSGRASHLSRQYLRHAGGEVRVSSSAPTGG